MKPVHPGWIALRLVLMVTVGVFEGLSIDRAWPLWTWLLFIGKCSIVCLPISDRVWVQVAILQ